MKVGVLTYSSAYNYGAILQTYALQHKLNEFDNVDCEVIDYQCKAVNNQYAFLFNLSFLAFKRNIAWILLRRKKRKFDSFKRDYIAISSKYNKKDMTSLNQVYDKFIVGSDQVWNPDCTDDDETYFLTFVEDSNKKNSYAASFGKTNIPPELQQKYKKRLRDFNHISVREKSGQQIIRNLIHRDCPWVVDPVFLLNKSNWEKFTYPIKDRYVFVYQLVSDESTIRHAAEIAKKLNCKLYMNTSYYKAFRYGKVIVGTGIQDFLSLISNAQMVITDSFHGTAMSILFNVPFYSKLRHKDDANTRIEDLLKLYGLEDRLLNDNIDVQKYIDYETVNQLIEQERGKSLKYIEDLLEMRDR